MVSDNNVDTNNPEDRPKIKRPTTTHDDGDPTDDCLFDVKRVFRLIEDERYLSAEALYESILVRVQGGIDSSVNSNDGTRNNEKQKSSPTKKRTIFRRQKSSKKAVDEKKAKVSQLLDENREIITTMKERCLLFKTAKRNLDVNDDWTIAQTLFGVTTYYRHESDGSMSIKLAGTVSDCSLFDQVAVMREFDLNHIWAPFVTSSMTVAQLDKLDIVGWFVIGLPHFGLMRDALFRAIGCDSMYEDGSVLIFAQGIADRPCDDSMNKDGSIKNGDPKSFDFDDEYDRILKELREDPVLDTLDLPPIPTRVGGGRLTIRSVAMQIHVESPTSAITTLVANIDPNLSFIPQPLIDFVMKRMCGAILYKLKGAAKNIDKNPVTNLHAIKIREEQDFYKTFLLPKFEGVCKIRGWQMPSISAFELSDAQLEVAEIFKSKQKQKFEAKALKIFDLNNTDNNLDEYLQSSKGSKDEPKVRTMHRDLDDMSDISKFSSASSFWRSNPISNYVREVDERTQLRKLREIQESRERAAARLKPKSLNEDALLRLKELRNARNRQNAAKAMQTVDENGHVAPSEVNRNLSRWKVSLSSHGFLTKMIVMQLLMVSLFSILHLDTAFNKVVEVQKGNFWLERQRDIATLAYLGVAGLIHSIFCYISLIYAFSALQLGSIAGKRTRRFYSQYVHYVVAISSASMVGFGVVKPGIDKVLRWIVWNVYSILKATKTSILSKTPDKVITTLQMITNAVFSVILSTQELFLESNILGRCIVSVVKIWVSAMVRVTSYPFLKYAEIAIRQYEGGLDAIAWREDTFITTRVLLSYSAFFLLVLLILFNFAAKQARRAIRVDDNAKKLSLGS